MNLENRSENEEKQGKINIMTEEIVVQKTPSGESILTIEHNGDKGSKSFGHGRFSFQRALNYAEVMENFLIFDRNVQREKTIFCPSLYYYFFKNIDKMDFDQLFETFEICDTEPPSILNAMLFFPEVTFKALDEITEDDLKKLLADIRQQFDSTELDNAVHVAIGESYRFAGEEGITFEDPTHF